MIIGISILGIGLVFLVVGFFLTVFSRDIDTGTVLVADRLIKIGLIIVAVSVVWLLSWLVSGDHLHFTWT